MRMTIRRLRNEVSYLRIARGLCCRKANIRRSSCCKVSSTHIDSVVCDRLPQAPLHVAIRDDTRVLLTRAGRPANTEPCRGPPAPRHDCHKPDGLIPPVASWSRLRQLLALNRARARNRPERFLVSQRGASGCNARFDPNQEERWVWATWTCGCREEMPDRPVIENVGNQSHLGAARKGRTRRRRGQVRPP